MGKYKFSDIQRNALWRAYNMKCFYCGQPLDLTSLTIDHLIPEYLFDNPEDLRKIREEYELDVIFPNFSINDYCNWVPAHGSCNYKKGTDIYPKRMTLFYLRLIQKKLAKVSSEVNRLTQNQKKGKMLGDLTVALKGEVISNEEIITLLSEIEDERTQDEPLVITLGLTIEDVFESGLLSEEVPKYYPYLCDWLERDLVRQLESMLSCCFHYTEPSHRDGEILSVRLVFPGLFISEIQKVESLLGVMEGTLWWEILEIEKFYKIYGITYKEEYS